MDDTPRFEDRLAVVEDHLVREHRAAKRLSGFASVYAALSVAAIVLPWFPAYGPVKRSGSVYVHEPLIEAPDGYGFLTFIVVAVLVSLMSKAIFTRDLKTVAVPVTAAIVAGFVAILLLTRFGAIGDPDVTGTGRAMITLLFAITLLGVFHAVTLHGVRRDNAVEGEPDAGE